jgi:hypothetical protein
MSFRNYLNKNLNESRKLTLDYLNQDEIFLDKDLSREDKISIFKSILSYADNALKPIDWKNIDRFGGVWIKDLKIQKKEEEFFIIFKISCDVVIKTEENNVKIPITVKYSKNYF